MMNNRKTYMPPTARAVKLRMGQLLTLSGLSATRNFYDAGGDAWSGAGTGANRNSYDAGGDAWSGTGTGANRSSYGSGGDVWE